MKSLEEVLAYRNDEVVDRFVTDYGVSRADAEEIFLETKRWLWLCASEMHQARDGVGAKIPLLSDARALDMMWHTFLLFTRDYARFCETHFGFFVHHHPRTRVEKDAWDALVAADPQRAKAERRAMLKKGYEHVYDRLGPDVLRKWCEDFPARFKF